jgi:hypothetical protein
MFLNVIAKKIIYACVWDPGTIASTNMVSLTKGVEFSNITVIVNCLKKAKAKKDNSYQYLKPQQKDRLIPFI